MTLPFLITEDPLLLDDVLKLAAAAGTQIHSAAVVDAEKWRSAPVVLIGEDSLGACIGHLPTRRSDVVIVSRCDPFDPAPEVAATTWQGAVLVGAAHVVQLPDADRWLIDLLAESCDGRSIGGPVISVIPGSGGAGATTFARLLALSVEGSLLVELDPLVMPHPFVSEGLRWPDLADTRGRIPPGTLGDALPHWGGARVLTGMFDGVTEEPVAAVLAAGAKGFPLTVVDVPKSLAAIPRVAWSCSDLVVVVVGPTAHRADEALTLLGHLGDGGHRIMLVPRTTSGVPSTWPVLLPEIAEHPVTPTWRHDRSLTGGGSPTMASPRSHRDAVAAVQEAVGIRTRRRRRGAA